MSDSSLSRLLRLWYEPVEVFRSIVARPSVLAALLLLIALKAGGSIVTLQYVDLDDFIPKLLAERNVELSAEQLSQAIEREEKLGWVRALVVSGVIWPVAVGVLAFLLMVAFTLQGRELGFKLSFALTAHGLLPMALASVVATLVVVLRGHLDYEEARTGSFILSNPAFLLGEDAAPAVRTVLQDLDLFLLWSVWLLTLGYREGAAVSTARSAATLGAFYAVFVLGHAAFSMFFG